MEQIDSVPLTEYPELSSYNSCFSYFGRSILPPVISSTSRAEINTYREKAALVEERIKKLKEEEEQKKELLEIIQEVIDTVIVVQNNENQSNNSSMEECKSNSRSLIPIAKTNLGSNVHYEEIMHDGDDDDGSQCNETVAVLKYRVNGWMSDSETAAKKSLNNLPKPLPNFPICDNIHYPVSESDIPSSNQSTDLDKYLDTSIEYEHVSSVSSSSEKSPDIPDTVISIGESFETLDNSSRTITPPKNLCNENLGSSVTHSDGSNNNLHLEVAESEPTNCFSLNENVNNESNSNRKSWLSKVLSKSISSKDLSTSVSNLGEKDSLSPLPPRLVRSNSYTLDSPSPVLLMSHLGCQCTTCPAPVIGPHCCSIDPKTKLTSTVDSSDKSVDQFDNNLHHENKNLFVEKSDVLLTVDNEGKNSTSDDISPSSSMLLELNSNTSLCISGPETNSQVSMISETEDIQELPIISSVNSLDSERSENTHEFDIAKELYSKFVDIREKTLMDFQMDQNKQLEAVKEKFARKEKELRQKLSSLSLSSSSRSGSTSSLVPKFDRLTPMSSAVHEFNKQDNVHGIDNQLSPVASCRSMLTGQSVINSLCNKNVDKSNPSYHREQSKQLPRTPPPDKHFEKRFIDVTSPISKMRSYIANNNNMLAQRSQKPIEEIINTPEMQKKFEKVTALAKGFLTRRLWNSHRVQGIMSGIKLAAQEMSAIHETIINRENDSNPSEEDFKKQREVFERVNHMDAMLAYIFFGMNVKDRMEIIAETREIERRQKCPTLPLSVTQKIDVSSPNIGVKKKLSSATLKSIERKKMSSQDNKSIILQATKKPLHERTHHKRHGHVAKQDGIYRRRILSPRSCPISPPSFKHKNMLLAIQKKDLTKKHHAL